MADRFTDARVPDPGVRALFDRQHRWQCWLEVEAALAAAEAECGVIPAAATEAIESAARLTALDMTRIERGIAESSHPLMALVTELSTAAGEHGGWVHWGATTQNITQTGDVLMLREAHRRILRLLAAVLTAAADLAERTAGLLAAGRTHGQHAVPITFGFKPAGWIDELDRHVTRLRSADGRVFTAMTGGPAGTFASLGQADQAMDRFPALFDPGWIWLMDRNYHGASRIARMIRSPHVLIRLKSDTPLKRTSPILPDGSYRAELSGDGVTIAVRVIEYWVDVEGQEVPEMFCQRRRCAAPAPARGRCSAPAPPISCGRNSRPGPPSR